jgi:non-specific serine/threonine protein kinase
MPHRVGLSRILVAASCASLAPGACCLRPAPVDEGGDAGVDGGDDAGVDGGVLLARAGTAAAAGSDGQIYIAGGTTRGACIFANNFGLEPTDRVEVVDPVARTVAEGPKLSVARYGPALVLGADQRLYAIGGQGSAGPTYTVEALSPGASSWTALPSLPPAGGSTAAALGGDGRIYANAGAGLLVLDLDAGWLPVPGPGAPMFLVSVSMASSGDGSIAMLTAARESSFPRIDATFELYRPSSQAWADLPAPPRPPPGADAIYLDAAAVLGQTFYRVGGAKFAGDANVPWTGVDAFDFTSSTWSSLPGLPTARYDLSAAAVGGKIYAIDGADSDATGPRCSLEGAQEGAILYGLIEVYDPGQKTWSRLLP